jgi:hypothetical protein
VSLSIGQQVRLTEEGLKLEPDLRGQLGIVVDV